jgi:hypothetical protein
VKKKDATFSQALIQPGKDTASPKIAAKQRQAREGKLNSETMKPGKGISSFCGFLALKFNPLVPGFLDSKLTDLILTSAARYKRNRSA